jgi:hypothetical protein
MRQYESLSQLSPHSCCFGALVGRAQSPTASGGGRAAGLHLITSKCSIRPILRTECILKGSPYMWSHKERQRNESTLSCKCNEGSSSGHDCSLLRLDVCARTVQVPREGLASARSVRSFNALRPCNCPCISYIYTRLRSFCEFSPVSKAVPDFCVYPLLSRGDAPGAVSVTFCTPPRWEITPTRAENSVVGYFEL